MAQMKTPGVYIVEKNAFPNSVVEVATAVPAFIGHTQIAKNGNQSLKDTPFRISSMAEFHMYFGYAPILQFKITLPGDDPVKPDEPASTDKVGQDNKSTKNENEDETDVDDIADQNETQDLSTPDDLDEDTTQDPPAPAVIGTGDIAAGLSAPSQFYTLYYHMLWFFANGGGPCYIVSVGDFKTPFDSTAFTNALIALQKEQEPTMIVIPEAVQQPDACANIQQAMLMHCLKMQNRFAILDVPLGYKDIRTAIEPFRNTIGSNNSFCAAYYPWMNTSILMEKDITLDYIEDAYEITKEKNPILKILDLELNNPKKYSQIEKKFQELATTANDKLATAQEQLHTLVYQVSPLYQFILKEICRQINLLPPSSAMAGIYTMVDNLRGVWKAPANVSVNNVISPAISINQDEQEDLNMPMTGLAVNAIRSFKGEGIKVWGARTMDGNSQDWRYINVRRTMIFLEESIKNAARAYVFEPNTSTTWVNMKSMIDGFLRNVWKQGGLAGTSPEDAYSVHVGLGDTMTPEDILDGILRITVLVAITRPAEFIEITFQQQMQKS